MRCLNLGVRIKLPSTTLKEFSNPFQCQIIHMKPLREVRRPPPHPQPLSRTSLWSRASLLSDNTWQLWRPSSQRRWYSDYFPTIFVLKTSLTFNWNELQKCIEVSFTSDASELQCESRRTLCIMGSGINGNSASNTIATKNHLRCLWMFVFTPVRSWMKTRLTITDHFSCLTVFRIFESFFTFF